MTGRSPYAAMHPSGSKGLLDLVQCLWLPQKPQRDLPLSCLGFQNSFLTMSERQNKILKKVETQTAGCRRNSKSFFSCACTQQQEGSLLVQGDATCGIRSSVLFVSHPVGSQHRPNTSPLRIHLSRHLYHLWGNCHCHYFLIDGIKCMIWNILIYNEHMCPQGYYSNFSHKLALQLAYLLSKKSE